MQIQPSNFYQPQYPRRLQTSQASNSTQTYNSNNPTYVVSNFDDNIIKVTQTASDPKRRSIQDRLNDVIKDLPVNSADVLLSGFSYLITALGCLGLGKLWFPKYAQLIDKHGPNISTAIGTTIGLSRVFLSPAVTPLSLSLAVVTPLISNRMYNWAENNPVKHAKANKVVYGFGILAKASKRCNSVHEGVNSLVEASVARLGRNITKDRTFKTFNTSSRPDSTQEHLKTIGCKIFSKYTWNFLSFVLLDWGLETIQNMTKK